MGPQYITVSQPVSSLLYRQSEKQIILDIERHLPPVNSLSAQPGLSSRQPFATINGDNPVLESQWKTASSASTNLHGNGDIVLSRQPSSRGKGIGSSRSGDTGSTEESSTESALDISSPLLEADPPTTGPVDFQVKLIL